MGHTQAQNLMKRDVMCSIPPEVIHGVTGVIHTEQLKKKKEKEMAVNTDKIGVYLRTLHLLYQ